MVFSGAWCARRCEHQVTQAPLCPCCCRKLTALHHAATKACADIVEVLLKHGAKVRCGLGSGEENDGVGMHACMGVVYTCMHTCRGCLDACSVHVHVACLLNGEWLHVHVGWCGMSA